MPKIISIFSSALDVRGNFVCWHSSHRDSALFCTERDLDVSHVEPFACILHTSATSPSPVQRDETSKCEY